MTSEWTRRQLGDFSSINRGLSYSSTHLAGGGVPMVNLKSFDKGGGYRPDGIKSYSGLVPPEYELHVCELIIANTDLTRDGSVVGVPALVPSTLDGSGAVFSMDVSRVNLDKTVADARFLYYRMQLQDVRSFMQARAAGSTVLHLQIKEIPSLQLDIPPLPEQSRIAGILDTLDEAIRKTEQVIAKLQQMKQGLVHDLLTRGLDENGELRDPERHPEQFKDSPLGRIPRGWEACRLDNLLDGIDAGKSPSLDDIPAKSGEWGVLKVSAVRFDGFQSAENKVVREQRHINRAYEVCEGDLLITRANTPELVGQTCFVTNPQPRLMLCDKTLRLRISRGVLPEFIFYTSQMKYFRLQIEANATGSSGSMKNISQGVIRGLMLAIPELSEQRQIVAAINKLVAQAESEVMQAYKLSAVKRGLMDDLLIGRIRVKVEDAK